MLSAARYSRDGRMDGSALDAAFESGIGALQKLRAAKRWPARTIGSMAKSVSDIGAAVWSR